MLKPLDLRPLCQDFGRVEVEQPILKIPLPALDLSTALGVVVSRRDAPAGASTGKATRPAIWARPWPSAALEAIRSGCPWTSCTTSGRGPLRRGPMAW